MSSSPPVGSQLWPCPQCKTPTATTSTFCPSCGLQLVGTQPPYVAPPATPTVKQQSSPLIGIVVLGALVVGALWFLGIGPFARGTAPATPTARSAPTPTPSVEYQLTIIHGEGRHDPAVEREFRQIISDISAGGGVCNPEPDRRRIGDVLYAGWDQSGKQQTLLEFARTLRDLCR